MSAEPVAVYDVQDEGWWLPANLTDFLQWLRHHGINPDDTYRIEIHLLDTLFARVYQYDRDEHGRFFLDEETGEPARRTPFDVPVESTPPEHATT